MIIKNALDSYINYRPRNKKKLKHGYSRYNRYAKSRKFLFEGNTLGKFCGWMCLDINIEIIRTRARKKKRIYLHF